MLWSISKRWTRGAAKYAAAALLAIGAAASSLPASANPKETGLDWYIFVGRNAKN